MQRVRAALPLACLLLLLRLLRRWMSLAGRGVSCARLRWCLLCVCLTACAGVGV
eukprot:COSAG06_NODE_45586_length_353_cov_1.618110_1_plen_53_part_01